jgi:hypothetical protein
VKPEVGSPALAFCCHFSDCGGIKRFVLYRKFIRIGASVSLTNLDKPVLYSTMTFLAYNINLQHYGGHHYMWCTPYFGSDYGSPIFTVPPSSSPLQIYMDLKREVDSGDLHGTLIKIKRLGIRRGADTMLKRGKITLDQRDDILAISQLATPEHFRPVLCILPRVEVLPYYCKVPVKSKANPLSQEYVVADVPTSSFDVIRIG